MKTRVRRVIHYRDSRRCRQSVRQWRAEMARERRMKQKQEKLLDMALEYAKMFLAKETERMEEDAAFRRRTRRFPRGGYFTGGPALVAPPAPKPVRPEKKP